MLKYRYCVSGLTIYCSIDQVSVLKSLKCYATTFCTHLNSYNNILRRLHKINQNMQKKNNFKLENVTVLAAECCTGYRRRSTMLKGTEPLRLNLNMKIVTHCSRSRASYNYI